MFGVGPAEVMVLALVAVLVFGPDKLPEFARQAGRLVRQLRDLAKGAQDSLREELGPEYSDLKLTDLDPRQAIRKHILEAMDDDDPPVGAAAATLARAKLPEGAPPPFDVEAT